MFLVTLGPAPAFEHINLQELWNIGHACEEGKTVTESDVIQGLFCKISPRQSVRSVADVVFLFALVRLNYDVTHICLLAVTMHIFIVGGCR